MGMIRIVWGAAHAPTAMASYDAALAEANVHNYNLVHVSSVIPSNATVEAVGTAPNLGPVGEQLTVVESRETVSEGLAVAGLGWASEPSGRGIFYEAGGTDPDDVETRIERGLTAGRTLRDWQFTDEGRKIVTANNDESKSSDRSETGAKTVSEQSTSGYTTAVVLAVYGDSTPLI
ncbi:pyruvoyl-dependent arginine decarboxylase [Halocatena marina]|uniref:arginine decarboxylase n=1 Tax=Halocatena marina TaxID=2934937 RepID=A0ABD5YN42_9EURY|nr:pyruvoyl-dependent arginine decarboxylase [Halocatena marina]